MAVKPNAGFVHRDARIAAFSLVEVVLAMGIISFALITLVALLPIGLKSNRDSMEESQAINLLQALIADRQSSVCSTNSALYNLPAMTNITSQTSGSLYLMDDAVTTNAQPTVASYRVDYTIYPATNNYPGATNNPASAGAPPISVNFKVSWPAVQTKQSSSVETIATFMQP